MVRGHLNTRSLIEACAEAGIPSPFTPSAFARVA